MFLTNIGNFETIGEAYTLFDLGLGSNFEVNKAKINFYFNINNLFNKNYINHLSVLKEDDIANQGRNFMIGFDVKF